MDAIVLIRTLGALALLLGVLTGALWAVRRFDLRLPGAMVRHPERRLELVERLGIDQRRSAVLIRRDDREHLVIISPEGQIVVETQPCREPRAETAACTSAAPSRRSLPKSFTALLDRSLSEPTEPGAESPPSKRKH
ncbi:flagellar biosynthetic protein FliO [Alteriqipengyuania lutimaris]|uniref:Flagellar biogenesis protein n=1 Tax=Alteriqipengyuania lutimaris TaxID=1538146 RepID=A0A395LNA2_9SPHN|nr:flagellar biosynthetic protein FliO [Alteriqipengyuania lutimaris]MBB3032492.1 flagellar biogenesis protein FliO [Alteriqipengyuania lutimaris]RDS78372.1 flagellar biogenesis protein [Alteriqipengyuania lutimaris]